MHELAIIEGILEIVEGAAQKHGAASASRIKLRLGAFTGVVREALEFSFEAVRAGTVAEHAKLEIEIIPLRKYCRNCARVFESDGELSLLCPVCRLPVEIIAGREMQIEYIDLE
ncbi:MAG TPA: hydrogenase maturation nickel metallochaperone HypA [Blastocatellia bacterium]|nr:hydrogenase maturation nickel metallochaperone HypA [Blastocatellia bacterium]